MMREFKMAFGVTVTDQDLSDIVCNGLECGSYASLCVHHLDGHDGPPEWAEGDRDYPHLWKWARDGQMFLFARHEDEKDREVLELNREGLMRGVRAHFEARPELYRDAVDEDRRVDPGALDALESDAILQRAVFGEVVYG